MDQTRPTFGQTLARGLLALLSCFLIVVSLAGGAFLAYNARYAGRIYQGVTILDSDVGGLTRAEALDRVRQELAQGDLPYVSLHTAEEDWTVSLEDLGGYLDLERAVREAWGVGRRGAFRDDLRVRARLLWWGYQVIPAFHLDPGGALAYLRQVARQAGHPARRAQLWVAGLQTHSGESKPGRELDIPATQRAIERQMQATFGASSWYTVPRALRQWRNDGASAARWGANPIPIPLAFREVIPPLTEIAGARERIEIMLSSPLALRFAFPELEVDGRSRTLERRWVIDQATLASWLTLQPVSVEGTTSLEVGLDRDQIAAFTQKLADEIARPPREASFDYDRKANVLKTIAPGQNGYSLDVGIAVEMVIQACLSKQREVILPVNVVAPRVTRASLEAILPLTLISEGESGFRGSTPERTQNIRVAAARFNGLVVPPQATFSFVENLGLVTVANGYTESWIIYGNRTILGPGGGVCQVGTTCFRAAFWGGFPIIERSPHSYRVAYYEPPLGLDAAVFSPSVDIKFRNDTDAPLLILTEVDEANAKLYFRFYGKPLDRKVSMEGPITGNPVRAGDPVFEEDPTLAPGVRVQVDWAHDGIDATVYRVIKKDGAIIARERFFSRYEPWPARFRIGPAAGQPATPR